MAVLAVIPIGLVIFCHCYVRRIAQRDRKAGILREEMAGGGARTESPRCSDVASRNWARARRDQRIVLTCRDELLVLFPMMFFGISKRCAVYVGQSCMDSGKRDVNPSRGKCNQYPGHTMIQSTHIVLGPSLSGPAHWQHIIQLAYVLRHKPEGNGFSYKQRRNHLRLLKSPYASRTRFIPH